MVAVPPRYCRDQVAEPKLAFIATSPTPPSLYNESLTAETTDMGPLRAES